MDSMAIGYAKNKIITKTGRDTYIDMALCHSNIEREGIVDGCRKRCETYEDVNKLTKVLRNNCRMS